MSIIESIKRLFSGDRTVDTDDSRIDSMTAAQDFDRANAGGDGNSGIPPNYLPTGMDEGRPKK